MIMPEFPFVNVEKLADDLWVADERGTNVFILKGSEKILLLDTAYGLTDWKALVKTLAGDLPIILVNSHGHPDHDLGNSQFKEAYVGRFDEPFCHMDCRDLFYLTKSLFAIGAETGGMEYDDDMAKASMLGEGIDPAILKDWHPGPSEKVIPLKEGDEIDLGNVKLRVYETPGHSAGSIALFDEKNRRIFTGDTALTWEVWGQLPTSMPLRTYAESLEKLAAIEDKVDKVYPAHSVENRPENCGRYVLPPEILSIYAEGTRAIVEGKVTGKPYGDCNPTFKGSRYLYTMFAIGGMAYDPMRI